MKNQKSNPDIVSLSIRKLFIECNLIHFNQSLPNSLVSAEWSNKLKINVSTTYQGNTGTYIIRLNKPMLISYTLNEVKELLLHEMIHVHLFLTKRQSYSDYTNGGHGPVLVFTLS